MENHVEERRISKRQEREQLGWLSVLFRRKKRSSHQDDDADNHEHHISADSLLMRRNKVRNLPLFLSETMRKLKHAFRKEKPQLFGIKKEKMKNFQKSVSTKDHFFLERMTSISRNSPHQEQFDKTLRNGWIECLPEYSSSYNGPVSIWDPNSTLLLKSSLGDFIKSETVADDSLTIKDIDSASVIEGSSPFISKTNQIVDDEISKVEPYDEEILEETQSHLPVASPSQLLFIENEINPARGEAKIQPVCNGPMVDKESVFKYVKEVLDVVDSNREELYLITQFTVQLIRPAMISHIPYYPNQICVDHQLLLDCINEVLFEFCRDPQWFSFVRPRTEILALDVESIISDVLEKVYRFTLPMQSHQSLDEVFREDMAKDRWLDDIESIWFEISELILNELVEELMIDLQRKDDHNHPAEHYV